MDALDRLQITVQGMINRQEDRIKNCIVTKEQLKEEIADDTKTSVFRANCNKSKIHQIDLMIEKCSSKLKPYREVLYVIENMILERDGEDECNK